jgi:hypothetical protein
MAEDKKPKIDLKARLGKKTVSAPAGAAPLKPGAVPVPPPLGQKAGPKVDPNNPYASISRDEAPVRAEPTAIKIEMSEEVVKAQKAARGKVIALAAVAALVGGLVGFAFGGRTEAAKGAKAAVEGAEMLVGSVDKANGEIEALAETLKSAQEKLKANRYPAEEVSKLGELNIPFSGQDLEGKGVGRFKGDVQSMILKFAGDAQQANEQKEKLQSLLSASKKGIEEYLAQQDKPKVRWAAYFESGPHGPWVSMQALPEPFDVKQEAKQGEKNAYKWPDQFKITQRGKGTFDLKRYSSGDPTRKQGNPDLIPVNPGTQNAVCPSDVIIKLQRELRSLESKLLGDPDEHVTGLLETGKVLHDKLRQIGRPG